MTSLQIVPTRPHLPVRSDNNFRNALESLIADFHANHAHKRGLVGTYSYGEYRTAVGRIVAYTIYHVGRYRIEKIRLEIPPLYIQVNVPNSVVCVDFWRDHVQPQYGGSLAIIRKTEEKQYRWTIASNNLWNMIYHIREMLERLAREEPEEPAAQRRALLNRLSYGVYPNILRSLIFSYRTAGPWPMYDNIGNPPRYPVGPEADMPANHQQRVTRSRDDWARIFSCMTLSLRQLDHTKSVDPILINVPVPYVETIDDIWQEFQNHGISQDSIRRSILSMYKTYARIGEQHPEIPLTVSRTRSGSRKIRFSFTYTTNNPYETIAIYAMFGGSPRKNSWWYECLREYDNRIGLEDGRIYHHTFHFINANAIRFMRLVMSVGAQMQSDINDPYDTYVLYRKLKNYWELMIGDRPEHPTQILYKALGYQDKPPLPYDWAREFY